ncbi:MAG: phosphodiester glycosidase family protein [Bacteroidales bacterium]
MKKNFLHILTAVLSLLFLSTLFVSCEGKDDEVAHKGAKTAMMKSIADNVPYIQSVEKDEQYDLFDGIKITDALFTYCTKPTRMLIAEIDLNNNITIATSAPDNKNEVGKKLQTIVEQAERAEEGGRKVYLGINGDYYSQKGSEWIPGGVFYKDGVAIKTEIGYEADNIFFIKKDGTAHIATLPEFQLIASDVQSAIGGWQRLVTDGKATGTFTVNDNSMMFHPRTFLGVSKDNRKVYFFVIDGRQPEYSNGMRVSDMMLLCEGAGCYQALNIDGGGSTTMVKRVESPSLSFEIMNVPSDNPARPVINGLQVIEKE